MATITTKYSVGDVVYHANTSIERKQHPCPDCKGSRKWKAVSPAGGEYEFACPRCAASYNSDRDLTLDYSVATPAVQRLTIGSVQVNTAPGSWSEGVSYMCCETGVGSGSVYNESALFETEDVALRVAQVMANNQNANTEWIATLYSRSLSISDYELDSAALKRASEAQSKARSMLYSLGDLFNTIEEAPDKDAIIEAVQDYRKYDWSRDKERAAAENEAA